MRHVYECPTRWADIDQLGHVNNVVYVDYLQEARIDLMRTILPTWRADLTEGVVVVRHAVTYLAPMPFRLAPVQVECWITEVRAGTFTVAYEVFHDDGADDGAADEVAGRHVYVRASTVLTPYSFVQEAPRRITPDERRVLLAYLEPPDVPAVRPARIEPVGPGRSVVWPLHVRFSDVDLYRHVNNVKYFEYFQESRIKMLAELTRDAGLPALRIVVAQTDVDYLAPILLRSTPYEVRSEIVRVGGRSMTVESEIVDPDQDHDQDHDHGGRPLARARVVVVFWDPATQRSAEPDVALHAHLLSASRQGALETGLTRGC